MTNCTWKAISSPALNWRRTAVIATVMAGILISPLLSARNAVPEEEIVVTAQKREQRLQDVPVSIQVVSGDTLNEGNLFGFGDLVDRLPNVNFGVSPLISTISIRGVGTGIINRAAEQAVGMYIDGEYISRGHQFNAPFLDLERVEVLRGPQGVLQGKNSVAGAVVMTTRRPGEETEGYLRAINEFENEGYSLEGVVSGALADNWFLRLAGRHTLDGGWLDTNTRLAADGTTELRGRKDQNEREISVVRLSSIWQPSDTLELFAKVETSKNERRGIAFGGYAIQPGATTGRRRTPILQDFLNRDPNYDFITNGVVSNGFRNELNAAGTRFEATNRDNVLEVWSTSGLFRFDRDMGNSGTLTGISSYSVYDVGQINSTTMAPLDWITRVGERDNGGEEFDQFTQEIRLVSPGGETLDYILGLFYLNRTIENNGARSLVNLSNGGVGAPPFFDLEVMRIFKEDTEAWSVFGQVTWNISDTLRLTAGGRYSDETKDNNEQTLLVDFLTVHPGNAMALRVLGAVPFTTADLPRDHVSDTSFDPSLSGQWDLTDDVMLYASYAQATKAGGFNASATNPADTSFDAEEATGYEVGMKGAFVDGRLHVNLALFHTEFDDLQVSALDTLDAATFSVFFRNAAEATTRGFEADFRFAVTERLELGGALAYLDPTYDDFPGATCSIGISREPDCDPGTNSRNAAGDTLRHAPEWSGNLYADYRMTLANGMELGLRGDLVYSDEYFLSTQNDPFLLADSFTKLDLAASLTSASGDWTLSVVGRNVTDKTTVSFGDATPMRPGAYWSNVDAPRRIYLNVQYNF